MRQNIKAKETYYDGYRFRSRLEARWAVFFNNIGLEYEYEDSIGPPSAGFGENKVGLPRDFLTRRYSPFRRFRPVFSVRGSRRGSKRDPRFLSAAGRMPSYNKAATAF